MGMMDRIELVFGPVALPAFLFGAHWVVATIVRIAGSTRPRHGSGERVS